MGMTIAEKILASHSGREQVKPGEYLWAKVDNAGKIADMDKFGGKFDPDAVYVAEDHMAPPPSVRYANMMVEMRALARKHGVKKFFEFGHGGISHELFPHFGFVSPGDLIAAGSSHGTSEGCFNAATTNPGGNQPYIAAHGMSWFRVPHSIKFMLMGTLPGPEGFVVGKDIFLRIAGEQGTEVGLYRSIEFAGPVVHQMSMASRFTLSNQGVELGAKFAIFPCDDKTLDYLAGKMKRPPRPVAPDPDAVYEAVYTIDTTNMPPYVARPHDPRNSVPVTEVAAEHIKIDQGFIGSCASGRLEDFRMAARILKGRKVRPDVRLICSPASQLIWRDCLKEGLWDVFADAEALVCHSTCGPCGGSHLGCIGDNEVCITTSPRNFQGRMGSPQSFVYMGNAATVAASAVTGYITDPREFL
jgi:3-isopropylmalate/(R)-2-methylmalate dehydratase large subunit